MSSIDEAIAKGKKRRKGMAIASLIGLAVILALYFSWLFLTKGYAFVVSPERAAKAPEFNVVSGTALFMADKLYVFGSAAEVTVSAPKYKAASVVVDETSSSTINVTLVPLPATLTVTTSPQLDEVTWKINQEKVAVSPSLSTELEEGSYTVNASHPHYQDAQIQFDAILHKTFNVISR